MTAAPSTSIEASQSPLFFGIDVGGTNIKLGLVDDLGKKVLFDSIPTEQEKGPEDAIQRMAAHMDRMLTDSGIGNEAVAAVGLATPGTMDIAAGMILEPSNLPAWRHFPVRDALQEACGKPVAYANDAGAAAFGEFWVGSGSKYDSIVLLTLGTGVGGGIIVNDFSIDGEHSHGAECGHMIIDMREDARVCSCGQTGHLEAYCSATAIVKRMEERLSDGRPSSLNERVSRGETLSTLMLSQEAARGDGLSLELVDEVAFYLGTGMVSIAHIIDPAAVLLGGAVNFGGRDSALGQRFLQAIQARFRQLAMPVVGQAAIIDFADLGGDAGYFGAAGIARVWHRNSLATS